MSRQAGPASRYADRVLVNENGRAFFVPLSEVDWMEGARNYVGLHAGGKTHMIRGTLNALSKKLDPSAFVRVNRSSIVRLAAIRRRRFARPDTPLARSSLSEAR